MSDVRWDIIAQYPNAGQGFADAFQGGMQRNALAALAMNPNDPRAQQGAAQYAPGQVMQARQQQQELSQQEHDAWVKTLGAAAKMADTPEKWDQACDYFASHGHQEALQFKGKFSPGVRAAFMAQAGIADEKPAENPSSVREYEYARQQGFKGGYTDFLQYVHPPSPVTLPAGATVQQPGQGGGDGLPTVADQASYDALPAGSQYRSPDGHIRVKGGQTGSAPSATFP